MFWPAPVPPPAIKRLHVFYVRDLKRLQKQTPLSYKLLLTLVVVFSYSTPPTPTPAGVGSTVRVTTIVRALPADSPTDVKLSE